MVVLCVCVGEGEGGGFEGFEGGGVCVWEGGGEGGCVKPRRLHTTARELQTRTFQPRTLGSAPTFQNTTQFPREDPSREGRQNENCGWRVKKERNFGAVRPRAVAAEGGRGEGGPKEGKTKENRKKKKEKKEEKKKKKEQEVQKKNKEEQKRKQTQIETTEIGSIHKNTNSGHSKH